MDENISVGSLFKWAAILAAIILVVVAIVGIGTGVLEIPFRSLQYVAVKHSVGYVEARNSHMRDQIVQYVQDQRDMDTKYKGDASAVASTKAHMAAILKDVRSTAAELDGFEIASDVAQFLDGHRGE